MSHTLSMFKFERKETDPGKVMAEGFESINQADRDIKELRVIFSPKRWIGSPTRAGADGRSENDFHGSGTFRGHQLDITGTVHFDGRTDRDYTNVQCSYDGVPLDPAASDKLWNEIQELGKLMSARGQGFFLKRQIDLRRKNREKAGS